VATLDGAFTSDPVIVQVEAVAETRTWNVNAESMLSLFAKVKTANVLLRIALIQHNGKDVGLFRTLETFRLSVSGKRVGSEGGHDCRITRFMPSR
jgi:hypothetical protein